MRWSSAATVASIFPSSGRSRSAAGASSRSAQDLEARVREQMIGTQASISIGELRSIQRVRARRRADARARTRSAACRPITNALFVSGGVKKIGSLRNIQLKRSGRTVTTLDLYDLLLRGDTSADARLLPGDVIFVPPVGTTVGLGGEVRRPAIYELKRRNDCRPAAAARRRADAGSGPDGRDARARRRATLARDGRRRSGERSRPVAAAARAATRCAFRRSGPCSRIRSS